MNYRKALKIGVAVLLVSALFYFADLSQIADRLRAADNRFYLAGVLFFLATYIPASLRWRNLSESIGYNLTRSTSFRIIAVSYSFNKLFPGNSGDVLRSKIFQRYQEIRNHGNILGIVALERFLDIIGLGTVIFFSALFVASSYLSQVFWLLVPFAALAFAFGFGLFLSEKWMNRILGITPIGEDFLSDIMEGYRSCSRRSLGINLVYSLGIWVLEAFAFYYFIRALSLDLTFWDGALITSLMSLVSGLPITPGGIGAVDATGTGLLVFAGLNYSDALSLVVLQRSIGLVLMALLGVAVYLIEEFYGYDSVDLDHSE